MIVEARGDVISLSGSLTHNNWLTIKAACNLLLKQHPEGIIIDCGGLTQCTPEGALTFGDAIHHIENARARIILVHMPPQVMEVVQKVPGVRSSVAVARSLEEARASLKLGLWSKGPEAAKNGPVIMVPLLHAWSCEAAIHQACTRARETGGHIYLVSILEVPRSLAMTAPLGEREQQAQASIEKADGLVRKEGCTSTPYIQRGRDYSQTLLEAAQNLKADLIVMGMPGGESAGTLAGVAQTLLTRAPCEVLVSTTPAPTLNGLPAARETQRLPD
jgi:nucleotide-binding universal stress UspA family protein